MAALVSHVSAIFVRWRGDDMIGMDIEACCQCYSEIVSWYLGKLIKVIIFVIGCRLGVWARLPRSN